MFALDRVQSDIVKVNPRIEHHGADRKLGADVKFSLTVANEILDTIEPGLLDSLYRAPSHGDQVSLIQPEALSVLKHPTLQPIQLSQKFPGYEMALAEAGIDEPGRFFAGVELKSFSIEAHEGGSATVVFSAGTDADADEIADLCGLWEDGIAVVTLTPPTHEQRLPMELDAEATK